MPSILAPSVLLYRNPTLRDGLAALVELLMSRHYSGHAIGRVFDHAAVNGTLAGCEYLEPEDEAAAEQAFVDALPAVPLDSDCWDRPDVFLDAELLAEGSHPLPFAQVDADTNPNACPRCDCDRIVRITPAGGTGPTGWGARCKCCGETWSLDDDRAMEQVERDDPIPAEIPTANPYMPGSDDDDAETGEYPPPVPFPPDDWRGSDFAGWNLADLPPIAGGAPDLDEPFEPSQADLDEYARWLHETNGEMHPTPSYAGRLNVSMLEAVAGALYGPGTPTAAR